MSDDVPKKCYSYDQAEEIVAYLGCYNLLDISYVCREQILYTIAEFVNKYKNVDKCLFNKLKEIQLQLKDDLKEYVDEIVSM